MSLVVALGSNIGESTQILEEAKNILSQKFGLIAESRIYRSPAVDYENQPDFFNQVIELRLPALTPQETMEFLLNLEKDFGRRRDIPKGPRTLDLDIIFWAQETIQTDTLIVPHPRWIERSFVVRPLMELPFFHSIEKCFIIPKTFNVDAFPI